MKKILVILMYIVTAFAFTGCNGSNEISRLAFVMSVGYDTSSYSFHIINPSAFSGDGGEASALITETISAPDIYTAMNKLNSKMSEKCDFSHIKTVIFSEEKLKSGIVDEIKAMYNSNTFHPNIRIAMCTGEVSEYMKNFKIPLDANPAEFYENIFDKTSNPYSPDTALRDMQKNYKNQVTANILPVLNNNSKSAVTRNNRLTAIINSDEALLYNLLTEKNFRCNYAIDDGTVLSLKNAGVNFAVSLKDKKPIVYVNVKFDARIIWSSQNTDNEKIRQKAYSLLTKQITALMNNCSYKYKADIFGLYKYTKPHYITLENWEKENWQKLFEKADYLVNISNIKFR